MTKIAHCNFFAIEPWAREASNFVNRIAALSTLLDFFKSMALMSKFEVDLAPGLKLIKVLDLV